MISGIDQINQREFSHLLLKGTVEAFSAYLDKVDNTKPNNENRSSPKDTRPLDDHLHKFLEVLVQANNSLPPHQEILTKLSLLLAKGARLNRVNPTYFSHLVEVINVARLANNRLAYAIMGLFFQNGHDMSLCAVDQTGITFMRNRVQESRKKQGLAALLATLSPFESDKYMMLKHHIVKDNPNSVDDGGNTALFDAIIRKKPAEVIKRMLQQGFDVNKKNRDGITPLEVAKYFTPENKAVIDLLINESVNKNDRHQWLKMGISGLTGGISSLAVIKLVTFFVSLSTPVFFMTSVAGCSLGAYLFARYKNDKNAIAKTQPTLWCVRSEQEYHDWEVKKLQKRIAALEKLIFRNKDNELQTVFSEISQNPDNRLAKLRWYYGKLHFLHTSTYDYQNIENKIKIKAIKKFGISKS